METTLTFNEEEQDQAMVAQLGSKAFGILWDIDSAIRTYFKHTDSCVANAEGALEQVREIIFESGLMEFYQ